MRSSSSSAHLFSRATSFTYISGVTTSTLHCINNSWLVHFLSRVFGATEMLQIFLWGHMCTMMSATKRMRLCVTPCMYDKVTWPVTSPSIWSFRCSSRFFPWPLRVPSQRQNLLSWDVDWFALILSSSLLTVVFAPNLCSGGWCNVWRVLWLAVSPGVWMAMKASASHNAQHCPEQTVAYCNWLHY